MSERKEDYRQRIMLFSQVNELAASFHNANPKWSKMAPIDFRDDDIYKFFYSLQQHDVKYLLVGGFAMAFHGLVRATHDVDLWIKDEASNLDNLKKVLMANAVPGLDQVKQLQLVAGFTEFKVGDSGFIVDPMTNMKAFQAYDFDACYQRAVDGEFRGIRFKVINARDLLTEKETANRTKDQGDIDYLRNLNKD
jgi:predicted nucleotidyltransferase